MGLCRRKLIMNINKLKIIKRNPVGRPREEKAPKIKVLISCFPEHKLIIKEFVNQLNRNL
jgi:hypothetical protein